MNRGRAGSSGWRLGAVAWVAPLLGVALVGGCTESTEYDAVAEAADQPESATPQAPPHWLVAGRLIAEKTRQKGAGTPTLGATASSGSKSPRGSTGSSGTAIETALTAAGLAPEQASCIATAVSSNPGLAADLDSVLGSLRNVSAPDGAATPSPSSLFGALDPATSTRLVQAIGPCLDAATLAAVIAGVGVSGTGGAGGLAGLSPILAAAASVDLGALKGVDLAKLSQQVAGGLGQSQVAQLRAFLDAAAATGTAAYVKVTDLAKLDIAHLDLTKLGPDQGILLLAALVRGLSEEQRISLQGVANVNLSALGAFVDTDTLTAEQIGALLLLISPYLSATVNAATGRPAVPIDPSQIYIPPGADLSSLNPLVFTNREAFIDAAVRDGAKRQQITCMYDRLRSLTPYELGQAFSTTPDPIGFTKVLLSTLGCILAPSDGITPG